MSGQRSTRATSSLWNLVEDWFRQPAIPTVTQRAKPRRRAWSFESLEGRTVLSAVPGGLIQGTVYNDLAGDGTLTAGDTGLAGVQLNVWKDGGNGTFQGSAGGTDDSLVTGSPLTTDGAGHFSLTGLAAGTYFVQEISAPAGYVLPVTTPVKIIISPAAADGVAGLNIDTFDTTNQIVDASSVGSTTVASSVAATEAIGGHRDLYAQLTSAFGDVSLNANAFNQHVLEFNSSATGTGIRMVTWDGDNSATPAVLNPTGLNHEDLTSAGASTGVSISLGADHDNGDLTVRIYTDATHFSTATVAIPNTGGSDVQAVFIPFASFTSAGSGGGATFSNVGAIQMQVAGAVAVNGQIDAIGAVGPTPFTANFANFQPASVGDTVFWDLNKNGIQNVGDPVAAGVTVQLFQNGSQVGSSQTTDAQGHYLFTGLTPGAYSVLFITPHGSLFTLEAQGADPTVDSDVNPATGSTPVFNLTSGQSDTTRDAGIIPIDLSITKTVNNNSPQVGSNVQFTITLANAAGFSQATGVTVADALPAGMTLVSATPAQGTYANGIWTVGTLASGASTTLTVVATVNNVSSKTNTAEVTAADEVDVDSTPNNHIASEDDQASVTFNPTQLVDLSIVKTVNNPTPTVGQNVVFTLTLTDQGPISATSVVVTDSLPAGLTFVSSTPSQGTYSSTTHLWTVGTLTNGQAVTLTITATVATAGTKTNTATITGLDQTDTNAANDSSSATVTPPASVGQLVFWDLNKDGIQESGEPGVAGVQVTLTPNGGGTAQNTTTDSTGHYLFSNLAPGSYSVHFVVPHSPTFTLENQGTDSSKNSSVDPATGTTPVFVLAAGQNDVARNAGVIPIDLSLTKTVNSNTPAVGANVNFTITVSNASGFSQATGVSVKDLLPSGLQFVSASPNQGTYDSTTGVWTVGSLASGASTSLVVTAKVTGSTSITNSAQVSAADEQDVDSTPNNNVTAEDDQQSVTLNPDLSPPLSKFYFLGR